MFTFHITVREKQRSKRTYQLVKVRDPLFFDFTLPRSHDLGIVFFDEFPTHKLTVDRDLLVDIEDTDAEGGSREKVLKWCVLELFSELVHPLVEQLQTLDLDFAAREAVDENADLGFTVEKGVEQVFNDLTVADHHTLVDEFLAFGSGEEGGHGDGWVGDTTGTEDGGGVCALSRARCTHEPDDFLGEFHVFPAVDILDVFECLVEDELGVLDL
jgi:hypothetical protein